MISKGRLNMITPLFIDSIFIVAYLVPDLIPGSREHNVE